MTNLTIFNNSHPDTERYMFLNFTDDRSLIILSGVNQDSYRILNALIKDRLFWQHPLIKEGKIQFNITCDFHPANCWKVLCFAYSSGVFPESNSLPEQAIPLISDFYRERQNLLEGEKEQLENKLELTCMSGYETLIVLDQLDQKLQIMDNKGERWRESLLQFHSEQDIQDIGLNYLMPDIELIIDMTNEQRENLLMVLSGNDGYLNRKLIPIYLSAIDCIAETRPEKRNPLIRKKRLLKDNLRSLRIESSNLNVHLNMNNQKINVINFHSCSPEEIQKVVSQHKQILIDEFESCTELELALTTKIPILEKCKKIILPILNRTKECSPAVIDQIIDLINSCPHYSNAKVESFNYLGELKDPSAALPYGIFVDSFLQDMYLWATDGNSQANEWTEEQFHKFLETAKDSISFELLHWTEKMKSSPHKEPI